MQVYWKVSVRKRNTKIRVNCAQSCNLLSGMCANVLSPQNDVEMMPVFRNLYLLLKRI